MEQPIAVAESTPAPMSLREHIAAEEPPAAGAPPSAPAPAVPVDEPIDPEIEQEINAVEAPTPEETPAEKRARTLKHKAAAEKAIKTRLANQRDEARQTAARLERELAELRRAPAPAAAPAATPPPAKAAPVYDGTDPSDPEPTLESFGDKSDPLVAFTAARADWAARREVRKAQVAGRQASMAAQAEDARIGALRAFDTYAEPIRKADPGFDARIATLDLSGPMQAVIFGSKEHGPLIADALAKNPAEHQRILALSPAAQYVELGAVKATVLAQKKAPAPDPITQAPPPPSQTAGGAAAAVELDTRKGVPLKDHIRIEEAEIAERRARGLRY